MGAEVGMAVGVAGGMGVGAGVKIGAGVGAGTGVGAKAGMRVGVEGGPELVLVTIIFIYEKRRKPDEVLDGELVPQSSTPSWVGDPGPLGGDALPSLAGSLLAHET